MKNKLWQYIEIKFPKTAQKFNHVKQEIIAIPVIFGLWYAYKIIMITFYPNDFQLSLVSQLDFMISAVFKLIFYTTFVKILMWIIVPSIYNYFKQKTYKYNGEMNDSDKTKWSIVVYITFLISLVLLS